MQNLYEEILLQELCQKLDTVLQACKAWILIGSSFCTQYVSEPAVPGVEKHVAVSTTSNLQKVSE